MRKQVTYMAHLVCLRLFKGIVMIIKLYEQRNTIGKVCSGVTRGRKRTAPGDTLQGSGVGVTSDLKLICLWPNLERTLDKRRGKMGVMRKETTAKKGHQRR